jgi:hypothetical protein
VVHDSLLLSSAFPAGSVPGPGWSGSAARSRAWTLRRRRLALSAAASRSARAWRASVRRLGEWSVAPALIISAVVAPDLILPLIAAPPGRRQVGGRHSARFSLAAPGETGEKPGPHRVVTILRHLSQHQSLHRAAPCGRFRPPSRPGLLRPRSCCRSSVVEHSLGKGEVVSSILPGSTTNVLKRNDF